MIGVRSHRGATSVVNRAMPMLTGTAMTTAMAETTTVPKANASVPKVCDCGSQTSPVKYESPWDWNAGHAFTIIVTAINARITSTSAPATNATPRNARSNVRPGGRTEVSGAVSMATVMAEIDGRWVARARTPGARATRGIDL